MGRDAFSLQISELAKIIGESSEDLMQELKGVAKAQKLKLGKRYCPPELVRQILESRGQSYPSQVISIQMLKGGVAKTTTAMNLALRAHMYGARVLIIDLDQQGNLSAAFGVEDESLPIWVDVVEKRASLEECIVRLDPGFDLVPSNLNNSVLDKVLLTGLRNWAQAVKQPLRSVQGNYDLVIIDTAPSLSATNTAVSCASDIVILPITPDRFSIMGLSRHLDDLKDIKEDFSVHFQEKILFTKFDGRESASHELLNYCVKNYGERIFSSLIRTSTEYKNSILADRFIFNTNSSAKSDYDLLTREILNIEEKSSNAQDYRSADHQEGL